MQRNRHDCPAGDSRGNVFSDLLLVRKCWQEHKISRTDFRTHEDIGKYRDRSLWNSHETLINNNQPLGKNSIKNIRFCAVVNCSSAYWSCALTGSDRSVRPGINKNTQKGVFVYSGWSARIRTMIKRTKISCPTIRRRSKTDDIIYVLLIFAIKKIT